MKLILNQKDLLDGINIVSKAVPSKTTMPILECIVVMAEGDSIKLVANDMDLGIETYVDGMVDEDGAVALKGDIFFEIVRKLPTDEGDVTLDCNANLETVISCGQAIFRIQGLDAQDFSYLPEVEKEECLQLTQLTLREAIRQTIFSISLNESNKLMGGELFESTGDELRVVSLDGHRMSIRKIKLKEEGPSIKVVVPGKSLIEINKILADDNDKSVSIYVTKNHILFEFDQTTVVSRLIEGEYFRVEQMISHDYDLKVKLNRKDFLEAIERSIVLTKNDDKRPIVLQIGDDVIDMKMNTQSGALKEQVEVEKTGKDILIGFNPKFLLEALRIISEEEVCLYMSNPKAPCFIRDDDENYLYLILPVNFNAATI
ncbi:MAG: DNA polymerase III subunit beta [Lachnospiraceae bacterium]|nr:DNA polymerase III subunit beta [Lachnospiraceae bacterium]